MAGLWGVGGWPMVLIALRRPARNRACTRGGGPARARQGGRAELGLLPPKPAAHEAGI